jgi:cell division protein ZapA (FtsZ GTPase activity inhibitor)
VAEAFLRVEWRQDLGSSEPDHLPDQDDVDAAGQLLVDLENLSDGAVLPVGGNRASVLELQAVLVDPLVCRFQGGDELLRADGVLLRLQTQGLGASHVGVVAGMASDELKQLKPEVEKLEKRLEWLGDELQKLRAVYDYPNVADNRRNMEMALNDALARLRAATEQLTR